MKKLYILFLVAACSFTMTSCSDWLDISPSDIVDEDDLFKEGTGYRNALNGVYKQMASSDMFGREFTYGMAEAMSQTYDKNQFKYHVYFQMAGYLYTSDAAKSLIQGIWNTSYNTIANCNNIIKKIESEPDSKFKGGKMERELILGEALALRGFLHFQMLCYFAPALVKPHDGNWIPYYEEFSENSPGYVTVENCLERSIRDLKRAQTLVEAFDLDESDPHQNHRSWLGFNHRFYSISSGDAASAQDIFYAYRGYRMNYMAVNAILARVYSYAGEHKLAADEAQKVIDFKSDHSTVTFAFQNKTEVASDYKMSRDLIFGLSSPKLVENNNIFITAGSNYRIRMPYKYETKFDAASDYRLTALLGKDGNYYIPQRYKIPTTSGAKTQILDIIPIIRLSEMYYIRAEYYASKEQFPDAIEALDKVRSGRSCPMGLLTITDTKSFVKELLAEARREFCEEGLTFYYHKKHGIAPITTTMKDEAYYFPLPDTETVN